MVLSLMLSRAFGADFLVPHDGDLGAALAAASIATETTVILFDTGIHSGPVNVGILDDLDVQLVALVPGATQLVLPDPLVFNGGTVTLDGLDLDCQGTRCLAVLDGSITLSRITTLARTGPVGGGILAATNAVVHLQDSQLEASSVTAGSGGHLRLTGMSSLSATNTVFRSGGSDVDGGSIRVEGSTVSIARCLFLQGRAALNGGGLYADAEAVTVADSTFEGGQATQGGDLWVTGGLDVSRSVVCEGDAADGAGMWWSEGPSSHDLMVTGSAFLRTRGGGSALSGDDGVGFKNVDLVQTTFHTLSGDAVSLQTDFGETVTIDRPVLNEAVGGFTLAGEVDGQLVDPVTFASAAPVGFALVGTSVVESVGGPLSTCDPLDLVASLADRGAVGHGRLHDLDGDGHVAGWDCDETDATRHRLALDDTCNGVDDDCDGRVDDDAAGLPWYRDLDGDGAGDVVVHSCTQPDALYVAVAGDCDDDDDAVGAGPIVYSDLDGDGFGDPTTERFDCGNETHAVVDNGDDCDDTTVGLGAPLWAMDADGDGLGDPADVVRQCDPIPGRVQVLGDCDDNDASVGDTRWSLDHDGDGFGASGQGIDQCEPILGHVADDSDCDDTDPAVRPDAVEVCNGVDDNCVDGADEGLLLASFTDDDGDGAGGEEVFACAIPQHHVLVGGDCDDHDPTVGPSAPEVCNGADDDCNGLADDGLPTVTAWLDVDGDGVGSGEPVIDCRIADGHVDRDGDCEPLDPTRGPLAHEVCNGLDDDCDNVVDEDLTALVSYVDADQDGYGAGPPVVMCAVPDGNVDNADDCNDATPLIRPGGVEVCNELDDDCDGAVDEGDICPPTATPVTPVPVSPTDTEEPAGCGCTAGSSGTRGWAPWLQRRR